MGINDRPVFSPRGADGREGKGWSRMNSLCALLRGGSLAEDAAFLLDFPRATSAFPAPQTIVFKENTNMPDDATVCLCGECR